MSTITPSSIALPHLAILAVQGADAGTFLQGQLTQDVVSMQAHEARAGGYCSAKGRLLANFIVLHPAPDAWWLVTRSELLEPLAKRLRMFVLRAKCVVQALPGGSVSGLLRAHLQPWSVTEPIDGASVSSLDIGWFGGRALRLQWAAPAGDAVPGPATVEHAAPPAVWACGDLQAGWPWVEAATADQFVPQMINFEVLGGVNFRKGCYPGQEVVARSQYRGTLKRRMALFEVEGTAPPAGAEVFHDDDPQQPAGMVVNAAADPAGAGPSLALVEVKIAALETGSLHLGMVDGPRLRQQALPYRLPTAADM